MIDTRPNYVGWLRKYVGNQKLILTGTAAVIRDEHGRVLLQQRRDNGLWSLPGGGTELGESVLDTNRREVREEMGVEVAVKHLIGLYTSPRLDVSYPNGDVSQIVVPCFECAITGGELKRQESEVLNVGWFDLGQTPPLTSFAQVVLRDVERYRGQAFFELDEDREVPHRNGNNTQSYAQWIRQSIGRQKFIISGTAALIRDDRGHVLLQKRRDNSLWGFPGGAIELGESATDAVRRETCEEMGLDVEPQRLIGIYTASEFDKTYPNGDQVQMFISFFECQVVGGAIRMQADEVLDVGWFDLDDLPPMQHCCAVKARDVRVFRGEAFVR
ncbi:MAG: NUDIX domain-containing protein [Chloroflexi bacterium]|nr:NUDIX domain-containing protein [Chloroflexota bacterium]